MEKGIMNREQRFLIKKENGKVIQIITLGNFVVARKCK